MPKDLNAEIRTNLGSRLSGKLRDQGKLPAVLYGGKPEATPLCIDGLAMGRILTAGERIVNLKYNGKEAQALIKDLQYDALGERLLHVDFNELRAGQKVRVRIPVVVKGVPKGHSLGGILSHAIHELEVECLPTAIPDRVVVDVEHLALGETIHVSELKLPEGVIVHTRATEVVAACVEPRKEEDATAATAEGAALEPEVLGEKKKEEAAPGEEEKKPAGDAKKADAKKPEAKKPEAKKPEAKK